MSDFTLTNDSYKIIDIHNVRVGTFGLVYEVKAINSGKKDLAIKVINEDTAQIPLDKKKNVLQWELNFYKNHCQGSEKYFILPLLDDGIVRDAPAMVFPYCEETLNKVYRESEIYGCFSRKPSDLLQWIKQIATGLNFLHSKIITEDGIEQNFVHRDVKPNNILLWDNNAVLIDFGTVRKVANDCTNTFAGNVIWAAPELLFPTKEGQYSFNTLADIYSLGLIIFALITGQRPICHRKLLENLDASGRPIENKLLKDVMKFEGLKPEEIKLLIQNLTALFAVTDYTEGDDTLSDVTLSDDKDKVIDDTKQTKYPLPDINFIINLILRNIEKLLSFTASKRPSANDMIKQIEYIEALLSPKIDKDSFNINMSSDQYNIGEKIQLMVCVNGHGLPEHGEWLTLKIDDKVCKKNPTFQNNQWIFEIGPFETIGKKRLLMSTVIKRNNEEISYSSEQTIFITGDFIQLWTRGYYNEAIEKIGKEEPEERATLFPMFLEIINTLQTKDFLEFHLNLKFMIKLWDTYNSLPDINIEVKFGEYLWKSLEIIDDENGLLKGFMENIDSDKKYLLSELFYLQYFKDNITSMSFSDNYTELVSPMKINVKILEKFGLISPDIYCDVWKIIGDHLFSKKMIKNSLYAYQKSQNKEKIGKLNEIILIKKLEKLENDARILLDADLYNKNINYNKVIEIYELIISMDNNNERLYEWKNCLAICKKQARIIALFIEAQIAKKEEKWEKAKKKLVQLFIHTPTFEKDSISAMKLFEEVVKNCEVPEKVPPIVIDKFPEISNKNVKNLESVHLINDQFLNILACTHGQDIIIAEKDKIYQVKVIGRVLKDKDINIQTGKHLNTAAISSDNRVIALGSTDGKIQLINFEDKQKFAELEHPNVIKKIIFTPDGRRIASIGTDKTIRLWKVNDGMPECFTDQISGMFWDINFLNDGNLLISGSSSGMQLWELPSRRQNGNQKTMNLLDSYDFKEFAKKEHSNQIVPIYVWRVCNSPCGNYIATASSDNIIRLWRLADNKFILLAELKKHIDQIGWIVFSPDGTLLISVSRDKKVYFWNVSEQAINDSSIKVIHSLEGESFNKIFFVDDGKAMISVSNFKNVQLWRIEREL